MTASIPSDVKCCANCLHARISTNVITLRKFAMCKAFPPIPVPVKTPEGHPALRATWPALELTDDCDYFHPKEAVS